MSEICGVVDQLVVWQKGQLVDLIEHSTLQDKLQIIMNIKRINDNNNFQLYQPLSIFAEADLPSCNVELDNCLQSALWFEHTSGGSA